VQSLGFSSPFWPLKALASANQPGVLGIIIGIEGPSYRPLGATMAIFQDKSVAGSLSSGCVEADLTHHAIECLNSGEPKIARYGVGSGICDIRLPCGGGIQILLVPNPCREELAKAEALATKRQEFTLRVDTDTGQIQIMTCNEQTHAGSVFSKRFSPDIRFLIFGKGAEASTFARLVNSAGYEHVIHSPDKATLADATFAQCNANHLTSLKIPEDEVIDDQTAIVLFFHDHEMELQILATAVQSSAFYVGAQGSQKAHQARLSALKKSGTIGNAWNSIRGPIGLIPSARDPRVLAVSVLAEILEAEQGVVT